MKKDTQNVSTENISFYLRKSEFWIGLGALLIVVVLAGSFLYKKVSPSIAGRMQKKQMAYVTPTKTVAMAVTKAPKITEEATIIPTKQVAPSPTATVSIKKVAQLANTSGDIQEVVLKGDSFWKISVRVCGEGRFYLATQHYNGYRDHDKLHEGDVVTVLCHE